MDLALGVLLACAALGLFHRTAPRRAYLIAFIGALAVAFVFLNFPSYMT
jgi:hypothetical protein